MLQYHRLQITPSLSYCRHRRELVSLRTRVVTSHFTGRGHRGCTSRLPYDFSSRLLPPLWAKLAPPGTSRSTIFANWGKRLPYLIHVVCLPNNLVCLPPPLWKKWSPPASLMSCPPHHCYRNQSPKTCALFACFSEPFVAICG